MDSVKKSLSAPRSAKMHRFLPTPMAVTVPHCLYEEIQSIALLKSEVCCLGIYTLKRKGSLSVLTGLLIAKDLSFL